MSWCLGGKNLSFVFLRDSRETLGFYASALAKSEFGCGGAKRSRAKSSAVKSCSFLLHTALKQPCAVLVFPIQNQKSKI